MESKKRFRNEIKWSAWRTKIAAVTVVIALYGILQVFGVTCPIKYVTGISCAGCGMTRAWLAVLRGDVSQAFYYHPLFILPPVALVILFLKPRINKKWYKGMIGAVIIMFLVVYLYRMCIEHDHIVVFEPQNGLIAKTLEKIHIKIK